MKHKIICGHVLDVLKTLQDESVDTIITSPPYWKLRSYLPDNHPDKDKEIGQESTLDEYISHLLEVTRELKRVLKKTGVMFWNHDTNKQKLCDSMQNYRLVIRMIDEQGWLMPKKGPIIWFKPNHMPDSFKRGFTHSYEPVFMLVKSKEASNDIKEFIKPPISDNWRAWLAAIIDAEGTIGIRRSKREKNHDVFAAYITVSNINKELVEKCFKITKLGTIKDSGVKTNFPVYRWEVTHQKAISVIAEIYPYLIAKKEQAKVAIALQKTNKYRGNNKGTNRGPKPISEKEYREKIRLWELVKKLNQKEINESGLPEPNLNRYSGCERYWFDLDAVRVPHKESSKKRVLRAVSNKHKYLSHPEYSGGGGINKPRPNRRKLSINFSDLFGESNKEYHREQNMAISQYQYAEGDYLVVNLHPSGANPGDVWSISNQSFSGAHFAVFGEKFVEPLIKVACPQWICKKCKKPRERIVKVRINEDKVPDRWKKTYRGKVELPNSPTQRSVSELYKEALSKERYTIGWTDCRCNAGWEAGVVLDPFAGRGTVGIVAEKLGRNSILIDLNKDYCEMAYRGLKPLVAQKKLTGEESIIEKIGF